MICVVMVWLEETRLVMIRTLLMATDALQFVSLKQPFSVKELQVSATHVFSIVLTVLIILHALLVIYFLTGTQLLWLAKLIALQLHNV